MTEELNGDVIEVKSSAKEKKGKKKKKQDWEDDISKDIEEIFQEHAPEVDSKDDPVINDEPKSVAKESKKSKKKKKQELDDDMYKDLEKVTDENTFKGKESINDVADMENAEVNKKEQSKKSKKKKKQNWEDDIAKELEELKLGNTPKDVEVDHADVSEKNEADDHRSSADMKVDIDSENKGLGQEQSKKSKKKKKQNWEDDVAKDLEEMHLESKSSLSFAGTDASSVEVKLKEETVTLESEGYSVPPDSTPVDEDEGMSKKKKKKKKGKDEEEEDKSRKGKPNKKMLAAMKEMIAKQKEEEERIRHEIEEKQRLEEERLRKIEEEKRLEEERRERKRQKEKERRERLKAEGKWLTTKQKHEQKRAQAMLVHLKAMGLDIPGQGEKRPRISSRLRPKKAKSQEPVDKIKDDEEVCVDAEGEVSREVEDEEEEEKTWEGEEDDDLKDTWDQSTDEEGSILEEISSKCVAKSVRAEKIERLGEGSETEGSDDELKSEHDKRRARALAKIEKRREENEKRRTPDNLRAPVVCVLGHVDHGKTKILDKLRKTNVQEGEVGGITQQIGATNVPFEALRTQTRLVKDFDVESLKFPGLLIIDTPGHESFSNLRSRGSSLCDIAVLVIDITQGLEPQTIESLNLLKTRKTPFLVALNKVDRVFEWESQPSKDISDIIKMQKQSTQNDFDRRIKQIIQDLNIQGMNAALFWENPDTRMYVSLVPTSAITGDGMGNLISLICDLCQQKLSKRLMFSEELQCTVLEVKTIQGHGTTIDVILINGRLREGDSIVLAGTEGPIHTQIRSLLLPKPMKEIRIKGQYDEFKEITAAQGVKIAAKDLDKAIAGLSLVVSYNEDEVEIVKEEVDREFKAAMRSIKLKERGVYVQASTLGALEALLEFLKSNDVPYSGIRVGPVAKRDVVKAVAMLEHDPLYAVILAFDVKIERDAQELADKEGIRIFSEETIYHLGDRYLEFIKEHKKKKQEEFKHIAVFPCRLKVIPSAIFNKRDPIVIGVSVDAGIIQTGTPLCVPSNEFVDIGIVTSLEYDHKPVDKARQGMDVCIKIEPVPGTTPKLFGRHFDATDVLVSKISRESINACKDYFREELNKNEWKLMADLKKEFQIL